MKLTQKEKEIMELVRNISHQNIERINSILMALMTHALLSYTEGEPIVIPYFGTFLIRYKGDKNTPSGKEAVLECFFDPSPILKENIGSYEDLKSGNTNISSIPIVKYLESINEQVLHETLNNISMDYNDED